MKKVFLVMAALGLLSLVVGTAVYAAPKNGTFDINTAGGGISFAPVPWVSPGGSQVIYFYPFATSDYLAGYSGNGAGYNLATAQFQSGNINVSDGISRAGDLAIRIGNYTGATQTWAAGKVTLDFTSGSFDVFLPEFTFNAMDNMYFWVADNGATYFANTSKSSGAPNMTAAAAMNAGDTYLAADAVPEPSSIIALLGGLGSILAFRRRRA